MRNQEEEEATTAATADPDTSFSSKFRCADIRVQIPLRTVNIWEIKMQILIKKLNTAVALRAKAKAKANAEAALICLIDAMLDEIPLDSISKMV